MPTEKGLSNLIINKVESKEVYNYMVANNLVNEDEMYLVQGDDEVQIIVDSALSTTSENPVQNKVVATAINNLNTLVGDTPVATQITSAINDAGFLTVDLNNTESGTVPFTNSDMLGGLPASSYLQVADFPQALTDAGVVKSVGGKTPNANGEITLVPADIGAATSEHTHDYVPTSRTVNGKALSSDISLTYSDVGAAAGSHTHSDYVTKNMFSLSGSTLTITTT